MTISWCSIILINFPSKSWRRSVLAAVHHLAEGETSRKINSFVKATLRANICLILSCFTPTSTLLTSVCHEICFWWLRHQNFGRKWSFCEVSLFLFSQLRVFRCETNPWEEWKGERRKHLYWKKINFFGCVPPRF